MPTSFLQKLANRKGVSPDDIERYWNDAKKAAKEKSIPEDSENFYKYVTAIVKKRSGLREQLKPYKRITRFV